VTLLDAYALVALVADEPAADEVEALLREGGCRMLIINLAEAVDISRRVHGVANRDIRRALDPLFLVRTVTPVASEQSDAWRAAEVRARHYDRRQRGLSMADCFLLAHAGFDGERIATADPAVAAVARTDAIELVALPDSEGRRP
jgi:PIN domain nuclease of toxin-antitoxin system